MVGLECNGRTDKCQTHHQQSHYGVAYFPKQRLPEAHTVQGAWVDWNKKQKASLIRSSRPRNCLTTSLPYICTLLLIAAWDAEERLWPRPPPLCAPAGQRGRAGWAEVDLGGTARWSERKENLRVPRCPGNGRQTGTATDVSQPFLRESREAEHERLR